MRLPGDFGAALMSIRFDLEGGVCDPVILLEDAAGLVEHGVRIGSGAGHEVDGGDVHLGGEGPHMKVMNVDHTRNRAEF